MVNCKLHQIFLGEIASVQNYGAFIKIPGCSAQGLLHKSQVSAAHVDNVADVLQRGERVWCKVISVGDDGKIGLSMKYVNQGNGTDLDPNGVELQRDMQKKRTVGKYERKAIRLEAVLNATCTKCGTHGHLANDCFMSPDGKKYELIPEFEESTPAPTQPQVEADEKHKKHKQKKSKKRKKSKKMKQDMDSNDSDEKEVIKKKKKKYSKDQKKKKKYDNSPTDESTSDNSSVSSHDMKAHKRKHSDSSEKRAKKCKHSKSKHPDQ